MKLELTDFSVVHCVGLLAVRYHLQTLKLDETYEGVEEVDGEMFEMEEGDDRRPFTDLLDIGLICTTTGNKVFAVMKGAVYGGSASQIVRSASRSTARRNTVNRRSGSAESSVLMSPHTFPACWRKMRMRTTTVLLMISKVYLEAHKKIPGVQSFTKKDKKANVTHNSTWHLKKRTYDESKEAVMDKITTHLDNLAAANA